MRIIPRPDQDKRIAELEERLEKLQDEVKSLKKERPRESDGPAPASFSNAQPEGPDQAPRSFCRASR